MSYILYTPIIPTECTVFADQGRACTTECMCISGRPVPVHRVQNSNVAYFNVMLVYKETSCTSCSFVILTSNSYADKACVSGVCA